MQRSSFVFEKCRVHNVAHRPATIIAAFRVNRQSLQANTETSTQIRPSLPPSASLPTSVFTRRTIRHYKPRIISTKNTEIAILPTRQFGQRQDYELENKKDRGSIPGRVRKSLLHHVKPFMVSTQHSIRVEQGVKQPPSNVNVKNKWSYTTTPHTFSWCGAQIQ